ncbi:MAG: LPS-assembly protein LptD, partial [Deltaproteobacteria bacterium]|nr:LPS-assembly protein LptD [Deltaproteobacteria bacterium]
MLRLKTILPIFIIFTAVFSASGASLAKDKLPGVFLKSGAPIEVTADYLSYDKEADTYFARGNVVIVQDNMTLNADSVVLNSASGTAAASGNILIIDEGGRLVKGESLTMDMMEKTAVLAKGRIFFKEETVTIRGETLRKTGPEAYEFEDASYTSCECPEGAAPPWDFSAKRAALVSGGSLTGLGSAFRIKGVPVFYSPYLSVPVKSGRQTGLLTPRPRYSELRGFGLDNAFYWAISRNTDATLYLDVETHRGLGEGVEYRYIRTRGSLGEIYFYHFKERDIGRVRSFRSGVDNLGRPMSATDDRWQMKLQHTEALFYGITLRADLNIVSDDEYFIDFGRGEWRTIEAIENNISLTKNWSAASLALQWRAYDNLLAKNYSAIVRKLPEATFIATGQRLWGSPLYISMDSSLINFTRDTGITGQRLDLRPRVSLPLNLNGYFDLTPSAGPRATFYLADNRRQERYLYDLRADLTTTFYGVYGSTV